MTCTGKCEVYRATRPAKSGRYESGQKRCQRCDIFLQWSGLWCPCCGLRMRVKPRNRKDNPREVLRCKQKCLDYMVRYAGVKRYEAGQKRCARCSIFVSWEGVFCPCCGTKLRVYRKNKRLAGREVHRY